MKFRVVVLGLLLIVGRVFSTTAGEPVSHDRGKLSEDKMTRWFDLKVLDVEGESDLANPKG